MKASKVLAIGAIGLVAALLFAGAAMAVGPNGTSDNAGMAAGGTCDRDHDRLQDGSCDGTMSPDRACQRGCQDEGDQVRLRDRACEQAGEGTGDGAMLMQRSCVEDGACGEGDQLRLRDGPCHA